MGVIKHPAGETGNPEPTNRRNLSLSSLSILSSLKLCCLHKFLLTTGFPRYWSISFLPLPFHSFPQPPMMVLTAVSSFLPCFCVHIPFHLPLPPPALFSLHSNTISPHYLMAIAHCAEVSFARLSISPCTHCASEWCIPYLWSLQHRVQLSSERCIPG